MKHLIFLPLLLYSYIAICQTNFDQTIYLKNGSIINGVIIEEIPNVKIKIQTYDGNIFEYNISEIEKISKKAPNNTSKNTSYTQQVPSSNQVLIQSDNPGSTSIDVKPDITTYFQKKFTSITEIGLSIDGLASSTFFQPDNGVAIFALNQVIGKRTSYNFSIGLGFGVEAGKPYPKDYDYIFDDEGIVIVPITTDIRAYFGKKRIAPFLNIAPGYALYHITNDNGHTFITNFGFGILAKITPKINVSVNGGYRFTLYPYEGESYDYHGGFLKFGFIY